jgi:anti-sigma factor RsiW
MNEHNQIADLLPFYVSGALDVDQIRVVEAHLAGCSGCREELELWKLVSAEIVSGDRELTPPPGIAGRALESGSRPKPSRLRQAWGILMAQRPLVRREIWPASALVMLLGYLAAVISGQQGALLIVAPLVAAAGLASIYGPENDPAFELALATPISPRQILLARIALVFGYDLILAAAASLGLYPLMPGLPLGTLILSWLAPMAFLSSAALLLSLWVGANNALALAYLGWLGQYIAGGIARNTPMAPTIQGALLAYEAVWRQPLALFGLAAILGFLAVWSAGRQEYNRLRLSSS